MSEEHTTHLLRIPDYFPFFACKIGTCRHACCQGWPISITLQNYFDLLGLDCSPDLRRRLDGGMHLADNPSPEHYAQFSPGTTATVLSAWTMDVAPCMPT